MPPQIATVVFALGILGLFWLDRDRGAGTSKALWIPVVWLLIIGSRPLSQWLELASPTATAGDYLEGTPLDVAGFAVLLAAGSIVLVSRRRQVLALLRKNLPILLFFAYCALSVLWSDYSDVSFKRWIKSLGDIVMVLLVLTDPAPAAAIRRLLARTGFLLIPLSVLFIKYYPDLGRVYNSGDTVATPWVPMWTGVTLTKNCLGMITLLFGLGAVWRFLELFSDRETPHRRRHLVAQATVFAMTLWLLWMANSFSSLSCFLLAGGLMVATGPRPLARSPRLVHVLVAAIICMSFSALFLGADGGVLQAFGRNPTLTGRTDIWKSVLSVAGDPLVGTGFESFWLTERTHQMRGLYEFYLNEAHNGYLEVYLNLGWAGIALLALLLLTGYRHVIAALRREPDIGRLKLAYFVVAVVYNFTESGFRLLTPVWLFFLLATMNVPAPALPEESPAFDSDQAVDIADWESRVDRPVSVGLFEEHI